MTRVYLNAAIFKCHVLDIEFAIYSTYMSKLYVSTTYVFSIIKWGAHELLYECCMFYVRRTEYYSIYTVYYSMFYRTCSIFKFHTALPQYYKNCACDRFNLNAY